MSKYIFSYHALQEMNNRSIPMECVEATLNEPQQITQERGQRECYQSLVIINNKQFLLRIIVSVEIPKKVITLYLTTKIKKYWR